MKTIETRSWSTDYRGELAIHAGKRLIREDDFGPSQSDFDGHFHRAGTCIVDLPFGALVATCRLANVAPIGGTFDFRTGTVEGDEGDFPGRPVVVAHDDGSLILDQDGRQTDVSDQRPYGDFTPGRFAWLLEDITPLAEPVPVRGYQGLWEWGREAVGAMKSRVLIAPDVWKEVDAELTDVAGLMLTAVYQEDGSLIVGGCTVTHEATGRRIGPVLTRVGAERLLDRLDGLVDWTLDAAAIKASGITAEVQAAVMATMLDDEDGYA